jgi:hypothetical protein
MHFETEAQRQAYDQISIWVHTIADTTDADSGAAFFVDEEAPRFVVTYGSSAAELTVRPFTWEYYDGPITDALIVIRASVVTGADLTPECLTYLLRQNEQTSFGAFCLGPQNEIFFSHTVPMSVCSGADELAVYLAMLMRTANEFDDEIMRRWGGQRAADVVGYP